MSDASYLFYYPDPTTQNATLLHVSGVVTSADSYLDKVKNTLTGKYPDSSINTSHISIWVWLIIIIIAIVVSSVITFYVTKIKLK